MVAPLFSVILPTFERPASLAAAVASVLAQSVDDFELLVIDDGGSPPATVPPDERVRLVRLDQNRGPAVARNRGLTLARGRYLAFLDDDDVFTADRLQLALQGLERAPLALCWRRFLGEPDGRHRVLEGDVGDVILDQSPPGLGAVAIRAERALPFDERWEAVEDLDWWLRTAAVTPVSTVAAVGYLIRRHDGRPGRNDLPARIRENLALFVAHAAYLDTHPAAAAFRWKRIGLMAMALGDRPLARRAFARSLRLRPRLRTLWHLQRSAWPGHVDPRSGPTWPRRRRRPAPRSRE